MQSSKSVRVTMLFFCQRKLFWQKESLVTLILFELCLLWYLAQSQILVTSLYINLVIKLKTNKTEEALSLKGCAINLSNGSQDCDFFQFFCDIYLTRLTWLIHTSVLPSNWNPDKIFAPTGLLGEVHTVKKEYFWNSSMWEPFFKIHFTY